MDTALGLKLVAIGLPLIGALVIGIWPSGAPRRAREAAATVLILAGLAGLALFILTREYACVVRPGPQNCLFDGVGTLSVCLAGLVIARGVLFLPAARLRADCVLLLLMFAGWAGFALAGNLLQLLVAIYVLLYALFRLLEQHDVRWGIFVPWPDHRHDRR